MKIAHITINTTKLDESVRFYQDVLGLEIVGDLRQDGGLPIVFLSSSVEDASIELIENADAPYTGAGLSIGFHADDVDAAYERVQRIGLRPSPVISPKPGVKFFFIEDPNGVKIQLT